MRNLLLIIIILGIGVSIFLRFNKNNLQNVQDTVSSFKSDVTRDLSTNSPLSIQFMRKQKYPGSQVKIEQTLENGGNYKRYIVSFYSDGLKEYAYMTVPTTQKPDSGFPVIIFNHGYQIPKLYTPEGNYINYMDALAKSGYIIFKPDFRGNGKSQGSPGSSYFSANYAVDILNAISSVKKYPDVDPSKIGMWGHSMGGQLSLRVSEVSPDIKAVVVWGGVVGSMSDIIYNWQDKVSYKPSGEDLYLRNLGLNELLAKEGTPNQNPDFWKLIDPFENVSYINSPFQIHVGLADNQVPPNFSKNLYEKLLKENKTVEIYEYPGSNHDINQSYDLAMKRTIQFLDKYLK